MNIVLIEGHAINLDTVVSWRWNENSSGITFTLSSGKGLTFRGETAKDAYDYLCGLAMWDSQRDAAKPTAQDTLLERALRVSSRDDMSDKLASAHDEIRQLTEQLDRVTCEYRELQATSAQQEERIADLERQLTDAEKDKYAIAEYATGYTERADQELFDEQTRTALWKSAAEKRQEIIERLTAEKQEAQAEFDTQRKYLTDELAHTLRQYARLHHAVQETIDSSQDETVHDPVQILRDAVQRLHIEKDTNEEDAA